MVDALIKTVSFVGGGFLILTMFCLATNLRAQQAAKPHDVEGCKDSPLITRLPGAIVGDCPHKDFDQVAAPVGMKDGEPLSKTLEGHVQKWKYSTQPNTSALKVFRNIETALKKSWVHYRVGEFARDDYGAQGQRLVHPGHGSRRSQQWILRADDCDGAVNPVATPRLSRLRP